MNRQKKQQAIKAEKERREKTQILWGKISSGGRRPCWANADVADENGELTGTDNHLVTEAEKINGGWDVKMDPKTDWKSEVGRGGVAITSGCAHISVCLKYEDDQNESNQRTGILNVSHGRARRHLLQSPSYKVTLDAYRCTHSTHQASFNSIRLV